MDRHTLTCTFCKRSEHDVRKLVAGPGVYICDACAEMAHRIMSDDPTARPPALWARLGRWMRGVIGSVMHGHRRFAERTV